MAIITTANVKEYLGITGSDDDTLIGNLIDRAQDLAERFTNRDTFAAGVTPDAKHDGDGTDRFFLRNVPVSSAIVRTVDHDGTITTVESSTYRINTRTGEVRLLASRVARWGGSSWDDGRRATGFRYYAPCWPRGCQNLQSTYSHGWDSGDEPKDLVQALIELTSIMYRESKRDGTLNSESLGDYSYTLNSQDERSKRVRELLLPFVRYTL